MPPDKGLHSPQQPEAHPASVLAWRALSQTQRSHWPFPVARSVDWNAQDSGQEGLPQWVRDSLGSHGVQKDSCCPEIPGSEPFL